MGAARRDWRIEPFQLVAFGALAISFQRARQAAGAGVPRSYGALPLAADTRQHPSGDVIVPAPEDEAIWLGLVAGVNASAHAVRICVITGERRDAVTGTPWSDEIAGTPQNYVVVPPQRAMYGVQQGERCAQQFARVPKSAESARCSQLEITVIASTQNRGKPAPQRRAAVLHTGSAAATPDRGNGDCLSGVPQTVEVDPFGPANWRGPASAIVVTCVSPDEFSAITGAAALAPLDDQRTYRGWHLP